MSQFAFEVVAALSEGFDGYSADSVSLTDDAANTPICASCVSKYQLPYTATTYMEWCAPRLNARRLTNDPDGSLVKRDGWWY